MKARIAVLGGDGIGPEVTAEAVTVLKATCQRVLTCSREMSQMIRMSKPSRTKVESRMNKLVMMR